MNPLTLIVSRCRLGAAGKLPPNRRMKLAKRAPRPTMIPARYGRALQLVRRHQADMVHTVSEKEQAS